MTLEETLEEIEKKFNWDEYCIGVIYSGFEDDYHVYSTFRDMIKGMQLQLKDVPDDNSKYIGIEIVEKDRLDFYLPHPDELMDKLHEKFLSADIGDDFPLKENTKGIEKLKKAYADYLEENKDWWYPGSPCFNSNPFTVADFKAYFKAQEDGKNNQN